MDTLMHSLTLHQGALSTRARWRYNLQAVAARLKIMIPALVAHKPRRRALSKLDLEAIPYPDSALARSAVEAMETASSAALFHHCYRTYIWGSLLQQLDEQQCDAEILFVSAMLHDLGLTEQHHGCCHSGQCFTWDGVYAAKPVLAKTEPARAERISQAILHHLNINVPGEVHGWEAHYLQAGASLDVTGQRNTELPAALRTQVLQEHPRLQLKQELQQWVDREAALHPDSRFAAMKRLGFKGVIRKAPFAG
ncbi:MAG: hypothetical protein D9N14_00655 [Ketobacter sp.]|nr:MAG: hypothetical protein D9N14_00655 [Ketobacter sp.]